MIRAGMIWTLALAASLGAHAAGAVALYIATRPGDIPEQPVPETQLELAAYQVQRSTARETAPDSDQALAGDTTGTSLGQGPVATSRASAVEAESTTTASLSAQGQRVTADAPQGDMAEALTDPAQPVSAVTAPQTTSLSATPKLEPASQPTLTAQTTTTVALSTAAVSAAQDLASVQTASVVAVPVATTPSTILSVAATTMSAAQTAVFRPAETEITAPSSPSLPTETAIAEEAAQDPTPVAQRPVDADNAQSVVPNAERTKASLAFQGAGDGPVDPVSLSAFQSFMEPGDLSGAAADVRDGITGILSAVPCSRLQVEFDPTDNTLVVAGHVPEPDLRNSVVAAMQQQMGTNIRVRDNLLILPRPQCGALSGIASVGLPQSTDQITNPLLVGESTHAREFRYTAGNPLVMSLQGADYDAFVYVDYFDADGNVLHLMPNQFSPLTRTPAKGALQIGSETVLAAGEPGLYIEIGPPFGQEIAAAFASSVPLYDGVRPLVEPAGPYLDWLQERVSEARADDPGFKGEWVYFFVSTAAE